MAKAMKFGSGRAKRYNEGGALEVPEKGTGLKKETFKEAFRRARDRKAPDFEYNGETFSTEYKEEKDAREAAALAKKPDESTAETARLSRASKTEAKPKTEDKKKQDEPVPFMKRPIKPEYTKEVNDALGVAMGASGTSKAYSTVRKGVDALREKISNLAAKKKSTPPVKREPTYESPAEAARKPRDMDEARFADEGNPNFKRGGKVKKMASGGMARSASSRADGCAVRGKTRA